MTLRPRNLLPEVSNSLRGMKKRAAIVLAENLRRLMDGDLNLSTGPKLAKASGVSQKTINNIEKARCDTRLSSMEKLAKVFRVEPYVFLTPSDENLLPIVRAYSQTDGRGRELLHSAADAVLQGGNGRGNKIGAGER